MEDRSRERERGSFRGQLALLFFRLVAASRVLNFPAAAFSRATRVLSRRDSKWKASFPPTDSSPPRRELFARLEITFSLLFSKKNRGIYNSFRIETNRRERFNYSNRNRNNLLFDRNRRAQVSKNSRYSNRSGPHPVSTRSISHEDEEFG